MVIRGPDVLITRKLNASGAQPQPNHTRNHSPDKRDNAGRTLRVLKRASVVYGQLRGRLSANTQLNASAPSSTRINWANKDSTFWCKVLYLLNRTP